MSIAAHAGLTLNACTVLKDVNNGWYIQHQCAFDFSAPVKNIQAFFTELSTASVPLHIEQLVYTRMHDSELFNLHMTLSFLKFSEGIL